MAEEATFDQNTGLMVVTFLLSGVALVIGFGFLLAVVFVEPIVMDKYYKRWYDKRREVCASERATQKEREVASNNNSSNKSNGTRTNTASARVSQGSLRSTVELLDSSAPRA